MKRARMIAAVLLAWMGVVHTSLAADFPTRPVRLVVPWPPGGLTDIVSRLVAAKLSEKWGHQVVVDNRGGANGIIGADLVAKAPPDGYTLVTANPETHGLNKLLYSKMPYDAATDFAPISLMVTQSLMLVAHPSFPAKTVAELVSVAKSKPGGVRYATWGRGSTSHLAMEAFRTAAGIDLLHIPYKGAGPAMTDVLGGQIEIMLSGVAPAMTQYRAGKVTALAVSGAKREVVAPNVPTIAESGFPGFDMITWYGVSAPAGTPPRTIKLISDAIRDALRSPEVTERLLAQAVGIVASTPEEFLKFNQREVAKWGQVAKAAGIKPE